MQGLFERGIEEFNRQEFFEAHDTWEELWMETRGSQRLFYQGLIQMAVGFYHLGNGNYNGASSQMSKAVAKLEGFLPVFDGVRTLELVDRLRECLKAVEELKEGGALQFDASRIPRVECVQP